MKNFKLIPHRCGLLFTLVTLAFLSIIDSIVDKDSILRYGFTFERAAYIFLWGLFFGISFVVFDIKKIPYIVSRIIHFILNGIITCIWLFLNFNDQANTKKFHLIFFTIFLYVVFYWIIHFLFVLFKKAFSFIEKKAQISTAE